MYWTKINDAMITGTLWEKVDDIDIDATALIDAFEAAPPPAPKAAAKPKEEKPKEIQLLDPNRSRALNIMLSRFKISNDDIATAILQARDVFTEDQLNSLASNRPQPDEFKAVKAYDGDPALLGNAEKYVLALSRVPDLNGHIDLLVTSKTFKEQLADLEKPSATVTGALKAIIESKSLVKALGVILAMGNVLNGGTARGGANGFKISLLPTLSEMRGKNRDVTVMHLLVQHALDKDPEVGAFADELKDVERAAKVDTEYIKTASNGLRGKLNLLRNAAAPASKRVVDGDLFAPRFEEFDKDAAPAVDRLCEEVGGIDGLFSKALQLFGEKPGSMKLPEFLGIFRDFAKSFGAVKEQVLRKREREEKLRAQKEAKAQSVGEEDKQQRGVLDGVLDLLNNADVEVSFKNASGGRRRSRSAHIKALLKQQ